MFTHSQNDVCSSPDFVHAVHHLHTCIYRKVSCKFTIVYKKRTLSTLRVYSIQLIRILSLCVLPQLVFVIVMETVQLSVTTLRQLGKRCSKINQLNKPYGLTEFKSRFCGSLYLNVKLFVNKFCLLECAGFKTWSLSHN